MGRASSRFSVASIIVFVLAVVAIVFSASLGAGLGRTFGVEQIEARPSWGSTLSIASETLSESPVVGSGPNTFVLQWDKYRPQLLNTSVFWNADFTSGVGFIPTAVVTTGLLGALAWALVLLFFLLSGIRGLLLRPFADPSTYHLALTAFVGALYILVMSVLYLPSPALLIVCFALMGMYLALYHHEGGGRTIDIDFRVMPRTGFVAVLVLALTLVVSLMSVFGLGTVFASNVVFERGVRAAQVAGDLDGAIALIDTANSLHSTDRYYRFATLLHVAKINQILADTGSTPEAELQAKFQTELGAAVEGGLKAVSLNTRDYRNWQSVGGAYQSVVPLNIDGAYDAAMSAFGNAAALNPLMPTIPLARAQIELARENQKAARVALNEALALKEDFVPALLLIAQIELTNGNLREAIKRAESASLFEPSNPVTRFQVGVLKFENRDYKGAEEAFAAAVQLAPDYANARYYLGRTYLKRGAETKALAEFEEVLRRNPDSSDVQAVMSAIEAGRDPFAPATADDTE
jgi:tetratricopeptide (TPR) repeat protein